MSLLTPYGVAAIVIVQFGLTPDTDTNVFGWRVICTADTSLYENK